MPNWISRLGARFVPSTLAAKVATTVAVLAAMLVTGGGYYSYINNNNSLSNVKTYWVFIAFLSAVLTFLSYIGVRIWGREDESLYPDIDEAWNAGIDALNEIGLSPAAGTAPFFLVLGGGGVEDAFAESLLAAGEKLRVNCVPSAPGITPTLRWYATDSGIYLFCSRVGALCSLVEMWKGTGESSINWGESIDPEKLQSRARSAASKSRILTSVSADYISRGSISASATDLPAPVRQSAKNFPINVPFADGGARLAYLCRMIKRARRPRCGINGSIAILPVEFPEANPQALGAIAASIRKDLRVIHGTLRLRFPITGLVVGMEQAAGFNILARLLGPSHKRKRLGAGFNVYRRANPDRIVRLCDYVCDQLESFIYALFGQPNPQSNSSENRKMYHLLCQMRGEIKPKLCELLTGAFARSDRRDAANAFESGDEAPAYFSGCYFASTGAQSDEQAFVKGVFYDKLVLEQGKVEWTNLARRSHLSFKLAVTLGWALAMILLAVGIAGRIIPHG